MRTIGLVAGLAGVIFAGAAIAAPPVNQEVSAQNERARELFVCDRSAETRRAFVREHGEIRFVTAEDVMKAADERAVWQAPRCIIRSEFKKLEGMRTSSRLIQARIER